MIRIGEKAWVSPGHVIAAWICPDDQRLMLAFVDKGEMVVDRDMQVSVMSALGLNPLTIPKPEPKAERKPKT